MSGGPRGPPGPPAPARPPVREERAFLRAKHMWGWDPGPGPVRRATLVSMRSVFLYVKSLFSRGDSFVYSIPSETFHLMLHDAGQYDELRPDSIGSLVNDDVPVAFDMDAAQDGCKFFSVINTNPQARYDIPVHHLDPPTMRINIDIRRLLRTNLSEKQVALSTVPSTTQISLQPLVMDVARLLP